MFRTWSNVIRSLLIIINIISIVPGCLLMYVCFNFHRNSLNAANQSNPLLTYCCIIGEGLGLIIVLIAVLGLYGAIKRSKSTLLTYATILSIVVLLLVAMLVVTYTPLGHKNRLPDDLDKAIVNSTVAMYNYVDTTAPTTVLEDWIQKRFSCCGVNSPNDWTEYSYQKIPRSCCLEPVESSLPVFKYCAESDYRIGCWRPARDYFFDTVVPLTRDFILINIYFNVFCIALSGLLVRGIKKDLDVV